jgi:ectoine hydroxylase-related dioxygenase (phytanoyl-CoA dioxygenase family)
MEHAGAVVTLDSCRFTPPWKPGHAETYGIHWDGDPWDGNKRMLQGVLALTDTEANQGGFRCVPSLYKDNDRWPKVPTIDQDGDVNWLADTHGHEIVMVPARAGDLLVWDYRLPHGNSRNMSSVPRLAFYLTMYPASDSMPQDEAIESWRTGRCLPCWRKRPGYDRIEPWPPAELTPLGRRLLGLQKW